MLLLLIISFTIKDHDGMRTSVQNINPVLLINSQAGNIPERPILRKVCTSILAIPIVTWAGDGTPSRQYRGTGRHAPAA